MRPGFVEILQNAESEIEYVEDFLRELSTTKETRKLWRAWSGLLEHYVKAVSALRRATDQGHSKAWSDNLISQQKKDPILEYARQARDSTTHVFEEKREAHPRTVSLGNFIQVAGNSNVVLKNNRVIGPDGVPRQLPDGEFRVEDGRYVGGSIPASALIQKEHYLVLAAVRNRSGLWPIPNPDTPAESRAHEVAAHIVGWLNSRLVEAKEMAAMEIAANKKK